MIMSTLPTKGGFATNVINGLAVHLYLATGATMLVSIWRNKGVSGRALFTLLIEGGFTAYDINGLAIHLYLRAGYTMQRQTGQGAAATAAPSCFATKLVIAGWK